MTTTTHHLTGLGAFVDAPRALGQSPVPSATANAAYGMCPWSDNAATFAEPAVQTIESRTHKPGTRWPEEASP